MSRAVENRPPAGYGVRLLIAQASLDKIIPGLLQFTVNRTIRLGQRGLFFFGQNVVSAMPHGSRDSFLQKHLKPLLTTSTIRPSVLIPELL